MTNPSFLDGLGLRVQLDGETTPVSTSTLIVSEAFEAERDGATVTLVSGAAQWRPLFDTNFAAMPTQDFTVGDGVYIVDGVSWNALGNADRLRASAPGPFGVINGTGLVMPCGVSEGGVSGSTASAFPRYTPWIYCRPFAAVPRGVPVRLTVQRGTAPVAGTSSHAVWGGLTTVFTDPTALVFGAIVRLVTDVSNVPTTSYATRCKREAPASSTQVGIQTALSTCDVGGISFPDGLGANHRANYLQGAQVWGDLSRPEGLSVFGTDASIPTTAPSQSSAATENWQVSLVAMAGSYNSAIAAYQVIKAAKLEAYY